MPKGNSRPLNAVAPVANSDEQKETAYPDPAASQRILEARALLCALLLRESHLLVGPVEESLNDIVIELDRLRGLQQLYELWVS
jgi:hypothetical protein